jgi:hypothetical protein
MDIAGEMNRAFTVDGIPAGRIGDAEKLGLKTDAHDRFLNFTADDLLARIPAGAAGCTPDDLYIADFAVFDNDSIFRCTKLFAVGFQADLPGQPASCRRGEDPFDAMLFARRHDGHAAFLAKQPQVMGQIRVF